MKKFIKSVFLFLMVAVVAVTASGCISSDYTKVKEKLEKAEYSVSETTNDLAISGACVGLAAMGVEVDDSKIVCIMSAAKDDAGIQLYFCEDSATAKSLEEQLKEIIDELKEEAEDDEDFKLGRNGKVVYYGNEQAIKDAR